MKGLCGNDHVPVFVTMYWFILPPQYRVYQVIENDVKSHFFCLDWSYDIVLSDRQNANTIERHLLSFRVKSKCHTHCCYWYCWNCIRILLVTISISVHWLNQLIHTKPINSVCECVDWYISIQLDMYAVVSNQHPMTVLWYNGSH